MNGISNIKEELDKMMSIDFIVGNEDRHKGNFGILRNSDNLKWLKIAPIFDNGNCLFFDCDNDELKEKGIDSLGKAFGDSNRLNLELIENIEWYNKNSDAIINIIGQGLRYNEKLKDERIDNIIDITKKRLNIFEEKLNVIKKKNVQREFKNKESNNISDQNNGGGRK